MKKIAEIRIKDKDYKIDLNKFYDISIPIDINKKSPSFYDENPLKINYYKDHNNKIWSTKRGASCNVAVIDLNIHCGATHSECRSHITKEDLCISKVIDSSFIPCILISVEPANLIGNDSYHYEIDDNDYIITKKILQNNLESFKDSNIEALAIRTLPNISNEILSKNYNSESNPFFSNEAIEYLKSLQIKHLIIDLPSIDKIDDGGLLGNHRIFWDLEKEGNNNTITEFALIDNSITDGFYLLSINILNIKLDASPSRPLIYPILK